MAVTQSSLDTITALATKVDKARLRAVVEHLSSFHTRNTNSPSCTEAAAWIATQFRQIPGISVETMSYEIKKGRRVPEDKQATQVIARLPGSDDRIVMVSGHLDSINMQADPLTGRAPGANDDASGVSLALELARLTSGHHWRHTLVFVAFSGEEQGLLGSSALADRAKQEGWKIDALLSNDMVGNSRDNLGQVDSHHVRLFSDPPDRLEKNPQNSRELARFIEWRTRGAVPDHGVKLVLRRDRYGRGGDHSPFSEKGFSAVRFTDVFEEYSRQHTPNDLPDAMDWDYLANNARINLVALGALADADAAPTDPKIDLKQGHDTTITWRRSPGARYTVYWRDTTSATWQHALNVGGVDHVTLPKVSKDDSFFAVGSEGGVPVGVGASN